MSEIKTGEIRSIVYEYAPGTANTVPTEAIIKFTDESSLTFRASMFHFDQYSTEPCLEVELND